MKIRPVGAELFHADGRRGRHDEAKTRFSQYRVYIKETDTFNVVLKAKLLMI